MKRICTLLFLCATVFALQAKSTVNLGYCGGEISTKGQITTDGKAWVSGAIYLPADMLQAYDGCNITTLRAGLATKVNVDSLVVWLRSDLRGANLTADTITTKTTPKLAKGWNDVVLTQPYTINGAQGLYVGFSYRQKEATGALSVVGSPLPNACFVQLGANTGWKDMSNEAGILSIEAVAEGDNLPDYDLGLVSAIANPYDDAAQTKLSVTVVNNGQKPLTGFTLETFYENAAEKLYVNHFNAQLGWGEKTTVNYQVPALSTVSNGDIVVRLRSLDNGVDETASNNTIKAKFALVKKVLVEEFTTEPCGNCPRVAAQLHTVLSKEQYKERVVAVCHHSGYKTDWLTNSADEAMANRFGIGYAPAMMFDRQPLFDGSTHISPDQSIIQGSIDYCLQQPAHVTINFSAAYDEDTGLLDVTISGKRDELTLQNPRLTVYLLENDVKAISQSGASGEYYHQHVIRAFNSNMGDALNWDGNQYENHVTFTVKPQWVRENMQIAAFVGNEDSNNKKCIIDNADITSFPAAGPDAISTVTTGAVAAPQYFTLDGVRLSQGAATRGFFIEKTTDAQGRTHTRKVLRR